MYPNQRPRKTPDLKAFTGNCASCASTLTGPYCAACGQRTLRPDEYSLRRLVKDGLRDAFSLDAKLWKSFTCLFTQPGEPTVAYMGGARAGRLGPMQIFLIANLIYFFVQPYTGYVGYNTPLQSHMTQQAYSRSGNISEHVFADIEKRTDQRIATESTPTDLPTARDRANTIERQVYETQFNTRGEVLARSLVILLVPMVAAVLTLVFAGTGIPAVQHVVFTIHLVAWQLTFVMSLFLPLLQITTRGIVSVAAKYLGVPATEIYADALWGAIVRTVLETGGLVVTLPYLYFALRRVYRGGHLSAVLRSAALVIALLGATLAFRFILFWLTFLSL